MKKKIKFETTFLLRIIENVNVDTIFLGCIRPEINIEEYLIKNISPTNKYVKLQNKNTDKCVWVDVKDIAVFDILN
jgi:hypothetical protein